MIGLVEQAALIRIGTYRRRICAIQHYASSDDVRFSGVLGDSGKTD